jgi:hypothetical protein
MIDDKGNQILTDKPYTAKYFDKEIDKLKSIKDRVYVCTECGSILHRDINTAKNILNKVLRRTRHSLDNIVDRTNECIANWKWMFNHLIVESLQINS